MRVVHNSVRKNWLIPENILYLALEQFVLHITQPDEDTE